MEVNWNFGRVEVITKWLINIHPADVISFNCSREVYTILTSDELPLVQREIVENALKVLWIDVAEDDWENLQVRAITLH